MLDPPQHKELRTRLKAHCEGESDDHVVELIMGAMDEIDHLDVMIPFLRAVQADDPLYRTMLIVLVRAYLGESRPNPRVATTRMVLGSNVDPVAISNNPDLPIARDVVVALAQGDPIQAWKLIDDATRGLESRRRTGRRAAILGFAFSWMYERAVQGFPTVVVKRQGDEVYVLGWGVTRADGVGPVPTHVRDNSDLVDHNP